MRQDDCEYVVVGSGAGGGTLAARLAEGGRRVVLLEAGGDAKALAGAARLPEDYDVPVFHPFASENEAMAWNFFVRHYDSDEEQRRDQKHRTSDDGRPAVLYPRAGTLGGCTAHNAMILLYPHNADWNHIAELTGDASWRADRMRTYFERLENCGHRRLARWLAKIGINPTRHGWTGWLHTEYEIPRAALADDRPLMNVLRDCFEQALPLVGRPIDRTRWLLESRLDPNDWRLVKDDAVGIRYMPLTTRGHARMGARERVLETARRYPDRLKVYLHALATRVLFDDENRAIGVEYLAGERLYRAHPRPSGEGGQRCEVRASREVILAGGAFNTPQLLMLSGIGPRDVLKRHGIPVRVELPGVGKNLQDRYEVSVINRLTTDHWKILEGATFAKGDRYYEEWAKERAGVYATNGAILGLITRSVASRDLPDLFCMVLLGNFKGYYPGYAADCVKDLNCLTWTILKAHTMNGTGEVTLRSPDPRDVPFVNFRYFNERSDPKGEDLESVVEGVKLVRMFTAQLKKDGLIGDEELPGGRVQSEDDIKQFVRENAWGHHASCTCPIGPQTAGGVVGPDLRVHGTRGLRVADASVFPRIPGFFIASAVYMVGEKAADMILADAARRVAG